MTITDLLDKLGYAASENYLREDRGDFKHVVDYGHLFRKAAEDPCRLRGVYTLRETKTAAIPVVYVCDAASEAAAKDVHRLVWNQDVVPFLVVNSPDTVRAYPGFCREGAAAGTPGIEAVHRAFDAADLRRIADTLSATAVDTGRTWREWGRHIRPEYKVDRNLLRNLRELDKWLQRDGELARRDSHALIGKYVYLHYLRDRDILSDKKLKRWHINESAVFGRGATMDGLRELQVKLDEWLNGEVFPIDFGRRGALRDNHIGRVAATFRGEQPLGANRWQLHLDFKAYDFSYIPIEVLSIVYEQFLHAPGEHGAQTTGRSAGAYYTPIPVVNLMLSELEERRPLTRGMRVFDPACGSGAFLVQAFRRLIEKEFPPSGKRPTPRDLRELVKAHFVGLDTDEDACSVTRLSLILTLLDYVHPPDLEPDAPPGPKPPLPNLRQNIVCGNFFHNDAAWQGVLARKKADWVVGNPPWKQLKSSNMRPEDEPVLAWMKAEEKHRPVGNRQMARAFAWRAAEYVSDTGEIALFLPAMTLFEEAAKGFRSRFLNKMDVHTIVNFSNLRWVISGGRFTAPAGAFFFRPRPRDAEPTGEESIRTYSPLVANQEPTRPGRKQKRGECWSIVINASEIRDVPLPAVAGGDGLAWKMAAWGSDLDVKLMRSLQRRFLTIGDMEKAGLLIISQGLELREEDASEELEQVSLARNAKTIDLSMLRGTRHFFALPMLAIMPVPRGLTHARKGRAELALSVSRPPHVIVSEARTFAVYSDKFLVVPARQIGILAPTRGNDLLKALSVYLNSDLAFYYEFFVSSGFGIERDRSTLAAMKRIPTPLMGMPSGDLRIWANLHDRLAAATRRTYRGMGLWENTSSHQALPRGSAVNDDMLAKLNALVYEAVGLTQTEQALVHDLVRVRFAMNDGRLGKEAVRHPTTAEIRAYGLRLQAELDDYISGECPGKHAVDVVYDDHSGMVGVSLGQEAAAKGRLSVARAGAPEAAALERCRRRLRQTRSQWVYFDRNLRVYEGDNTYILKPMQRFHWTETQARIDAMDIVPESIARGGST